MIKSRFCATILFVLLFITLQSCNNKKENETKKDTSKNNSELVKQDDKGQKADLRYAPKIGDKFRYSMIAETISTENSPATKEKDETSEQKMIYFYSQEVSEISGTGVITYKMKFDSISISTRISSGGESETQTYNSNVKDSVYSKPGYIQYNALVGQDFKLRVSAQGEIYDVYELEKIHDNIFKALGDTLSPQDKESIKNSMGSEALKNIIQNQFQKFPGNEVYKDSTWTFNLETSLLIFPIKNILNYKLIDIKKDNGEFICSIEANLGIDFISKEQKENQLTAKIVDSKAGGSGNVTFNLSKGCIVSKKTNTNINIDMKLSAKGQSAKSKQNLATALNVNLIQ
jgi:hypothetical protein